MCLFTYAPISARMCEKQTHENQFITNGTHVPACNGTIMLKAPMFKQTLSSVPRCYIQIPGTSIRRTERTEISAVIRLEVSNKRHGWSSQHVVLFCVSLFRGHFLSKIDLRHLNTYIPVILKIGYL